MTTLAELKAKVARKLQVVPIGQAASAEDGDVIEEAYEELYAQLVRKNLVTWTSTGDIPDFATQSVVAMVAALRVDEFGVPEPKRSSILRDGALDQVPMGLAEKRLRKLMANPHISTRVQTEFY